MKEKLNKIVKNKYLKTTLLFILGIFVLHQSYAIYVDVYNFGQLEKAKPILESIPKNAKKFYYLKEFNERYNANINPVKNCYNVSNYNGEEAYIFGFKLESLLYMGMYGTKYYIYPKYYVPIESAGCVMGLGCKTNKDTMIEIISNPCEE